MDSEKKAFTPLDDGALDEVTGGSGTVQEDGSVVYECPNNNILTEQCPGTVVFPPNRSDTTCPVCGRLYVRDYFGALRMAPGPVRP